MPGAQVVGVVGLAVDQVAVGAEVLGVGRAVAGVLLIILPWTPEWTDNYLLLSFPALRTFVGNGFFRGICSGLGLLDIWIGFWEALHYHEHP